MSCLQLTFYTNHLSSLFTFMFIVSDFVIHIYKGQSYNLNMSELNMTSLICISSSCILGACISFFGWKCQELYTASHMSVAGSASKILVIIATNIFNNNESSQLSSLVLIIYFISFIFFNPQKIVKDSDIEVTTNLVSKSVP
jgi:hypothetical protein